MEVIHGERIPMELVKIARTLGTKKLVVCWNEEDLLREGIVSRAILTMLIESPLVVPYSGRPYGWYIPAVLTSDELPYTVIVQSSLVDDEWSTRELWHQLIQLVVHEEIHRRLPKWIIHGPLHSIPTWILTLYYRWKYWHIPDLQSFHINPHPWYIMDNM